MSEDTQTEDKKTKTARPITTLGTLEKIETLLSKLSPEEQKRAVKFLSEDKKYQ